MVNRFTMAQSYVTIRRWGSPAIATLVAMAALTPGAEARQARPALPTEATAPRKAGEPIMAIVSIKSQQVTFYDAATPAGSCAAPVSTGTTRTRDAGVFALLEKDKDHHSSMYDDAWMPNMQRITWNGIKRCTAARCPAMRPHMAAFGALPLCGEAIRQDARSGCG